MLTMTKTRTFRATCRLGECLEAPLSFIDRDAYVEHMTAHGLKMPTGTENGAQARSIERGWKPPKLTRDGKEFSTRIHSIARSVRRCPTCGLVAEVRDIDAEMNWWTSHLASCSGGAA